MMNARPTAAAAKIMTFVATGMSCSWPRRRQIWNGSEKPEEELRRKRTVITSRSPSAVRGRKAPAAGWTG